MIIDEPVRGRYAYLEHPWLFGMPPDEQMRPFIERRVPLPPIHHLTGLAPIDAGPGTSTWAMPASPWWQSAAGLFPGGALAVVADAALGGAIYNVLPKGTVLATSELSMNFLRPATPASERLLARASLIHSGSRQGLSEARIEDAHGRLLAHATSRCVLRSLPFDPPDPPASLPPVQPPDHETLDPYLRPPEGTVLPQEEWDTTAGLELVQTWLKEERATPPVCHLSGWRLLEVDEGTSTWSMPASEWFCTGFGTFYGGIIALFIDGGINSAVTTTLPPGTSFGTLDLKVNFVRPVTPDGRELVAQARVVHRGRTISVTTAEVEDSDGKRVAMATSSAMILPGVPWNPARPLATMDEAPAEETG
ncbi:MAG TPA: PaaI family thioesterase [Actinomycetota bacterium]|nr:PaaI family thioesterase [Actinomycetota bacterium]